MYVNINEKNFFFFSSYYTVTAPGTIRSNTPYNVSVTTHNSDKPIKCKIDITGPDYTDSQTVEVEPHTTQIVQFNVCIQHIMTREIFFAKKKQNYNFSFRYLKFRVMIMNTRSKSKDLEEQNSRRSLFYV